MKDKDFAVVGGGRGNGKTYQVIQNLTKELNEARDKYKALVTAYNEMVTVHTQLADAHDCLLNFLKMQCGILYTAVTGDVRVTDPLKDISILTVPDIGNAELADYRQGLCIYVKTYEETGDPAKAFEEYQKHLAGGI